jgi:hypothetical protein
MSTAGIRWPSGRVVGFVIGCALAAGVLAVGDRFGQASLSADASRHDRTVEVPTPAGFVTIQRGTLDVASIDYAGETENAVFFTAVDGPSGFDCYVIAGRSGDEGTATGCDPIDNVRSRGQFGYLGMMDGTTAVVHRSFQRIHHAAAGGVALTPVKGVVAFEVEPSSSATLAVTAGGRTFRQRITTAPSLLDAVGRGRPGS